jgi:hypothetical protein
MVGIFDKFVITVFDKVVEFSCNAPPKGFVEEFEYKNMPSYRASFRTRSRKNVQIYGFTPKMICQRTQFRTSRRRYGASERVFRSAITDLITNNT